MNKEALRCVHSRLLEEEKKAGCFAIIILQMYCYYKCSVVLPHGAMGWSAVCDLLWYFRIILTFQNDKIRSTVVTLW